MALFHNNLFKPKREGFRIILSKLDGRLNYLCPGSLCFSDTKGPIMLTMSDT